MVSLVSIAGGEQGRTESDRYLQLAMIRIDDEWLVDNVLDIASAGDLGGPVAPVEGGSGTSTPPTSEGG